MRWILFALSVSALLLNVGWIIVVNPDEEGKIDNDNVDPTDGMEIVSDIRSLTVPDMNIDDLALYDYELFAQMYQENYSSGEWSRYTFTGEGDFLQYISELTTVEDGFGTRRKAVKFGYETNARFKVKIESSESDTVIIPGQLDVERSEFKNLFDKHALKSLNSGSIAIENLGTAFGDVPASVKYDVDLKTYPTPYLDPIETLDESIYGNGRSLSLSSKGFFEGDPFYDSDLLYNWTVEGAFKVRDHDTLKINVTSNLWNWLFFERIFYVSGDSPFPLKGTTRTNSSAYWDDGEFYLIMTTSRVIKELEGSLNRGKNPIPWGDASGNKEYDAAHPAGEFEKWEYGPADGSDVERSSFNGWTQEQAIDYAIENSPELHRFMEEFEGKGKVLIEDSVYNISNEYRVGNNRTQSWNLSFSYVFTWDEIENYYEMNDEWPYWRYKILVSKSVNDDPRGAEISYYINRDEGDDHHGKVKASWGNTGIMKDGLTLNSRIVTMTHGEKILKTDPDIRDKVYENGIIKDDIKFYYGIVGINQESNPGLTLIQQLTGISTPTADNAIGFQQGGVYETGSTFSAALDANNGQLLYVTNVEGSQLASIFGG